MNKLKKILFVNVPWTGHVNPTLTLVRELIRNGYEVTYINSEEWRKNIEETGAKFIPYINYPDGELSVDIKDKMCQMAAYTSALRVLPGYDLLIYEAMFFLGQMLAEQCNKKAVRIFTTFAISDHVLKSYCHDSNTWSILYFKSIRRRYTRKILAHLQLQEPDVYLEVSRHKADKSIVCMAREFQIFTEDFGQDFCFCGPLISERTQTDTFEEDLDVSKKVIYISMGSILRREKFLQKCILALSDSEYEVVISLGGQSNEKYQNVAKNIHVYSYVNQLEILKRASLFITHGGMNSIQEALFYGVPLLIVPMNNDQFTNAKQVQKLKLGDTIHWRTATSGKVRKSVEKLIYSQDTQKSLHDMRDNIVNSKGSTACVDLINNLLFD